MKRSRLLVAALLPLAAFPASVHADDAAAEPVHVLRPVIHAEREKAEICLEFDRDLGLAGAAGRIAAALHLEEDGKPVNIARRSIAYSGNEICLSDLERRKNYRLVMEALAGKNGEKISHAYSLSFKVPGHQPALSFVNQDSRGGVNLWRADPVLNSVNGARVTVELFRIADPAKMAEAWNQRAETALAPSESLYFARHNGTSVWKKDITPDTAADKSVTTKLDIADTGGAPFPPGLYLIAATLPDDAAKESADKSNNPLTPVAAAWLLRSNLDLHALRDGRNVTALAEAADLPNTAVHVHVLLLDHDQKTLAEADTDADGKALLVTNADDAATVVGIGGKGDVAFADLNDAPGAPDVDAPSPVAELAADQKIYAPRDTIAVSVNLHDLHRHPQPLKGSVVQLLRPDRSFYDVRTVAMDASGAAKLSFTAPVRGGVWHLVWQNAAGQKLAETDLRVSADPTAPVLSLTPDSTLLAEGGEMGLVVHSRTAAGAPAPYVAGRVMLSWQKDDHPFAAWKDYRFDDGRDIDPLPKPAAFFVTGPDGNARLRFNASPPDGAPAVVQAELRAESDLPGDVLDSTPVTLPVKPAGAVIGIGPRTAGGNFPENSLAHFDIAALGPDGKPGPAGDLNYQVFEQGRSFEWYQADGRWNYKPQQQRRRLGGGGLSFGDDGRAAVEWPVTSGAYRLDITDADGALRARMDFNAGWNGAGRDEADAATIDLKPSPAALQKGATEKIAFTLPRPALVTASVADDHVREVIHAVYPAGAGAITFTPGADWGEHVRVRVEARAADKDTGQRDLWVGDLLLAPAAEASPAKSAAKPAFAAFAGFVRNMTEIGQQKLTPRQSMIPGSKTRMKPDVIFVAPAPISGLPLLLSSLTEAQPFATADLARRLVLLRLWREAIEASGLGTEAEFQSVVEDGMDRLLRRQNQDGGFAILPDGRPDGSGSDLAATTAAVEALTPADGALARLALDQAAGWLHWRLENTWFDEKEAPLRAAAYAALAKAGKLDVASLHYFSDTDADKPLPPAAMAAMALAFASIDDHAASNFWLDKATTAKDAGDAPGLEPYLLANPYFSPVGAETALEKSMKRALDNRADFADLDEALGSLRLFLDRAGTWRAGIGKDEKVLRGVFAMPLTEKTPVAIRNMSSDRPLYTVEAAFAKPAAGAGMRRRIYDLDGQEAKGEPARGTVVAVVLEGSWAEGQDALVLHDDPQPAFAPVTCALDVPGNEGFIAWLAQQGLTPPKACEKGRSGVDILLARANGQQSWRAAYLARALGGDERRLNAPETAGISLDDKGGQH